MNKLAEILQSLELYNQIIVGLLVAIGLYAAWEWYFGNDGDKK